MKRLFLFLIISCISFSKFYGYDPSHVELVRTINGKGETFATCKINLNPNSQEVKDLFYSSDQVFDVFWFDTVDCKPILASRSVAKELLKYLKRSAELRKKDTGIIRIKFTYFYELDSKNEGKWDLIYLNQYSIYSTYDTHKIIVDIRTN